MRRIVTILLLLCSLFSMAIVPPRDPSKWDEWQQQVVARRAPMVQQAVGQRTIIPRIPVILVSFSDFEFTTPKADVDSMFNGANWTKDGATGSLRQYFYDQSTGAYSPQFDVFGPVTLSKGYGYYGKGSNTSGNVGHMVTEACALVDDSVDFSLYDSDDDGKVDLVYVYYAGFGENDKANAYVQTLIPTWGDLVWPAYWNVVSAGASSDPRTFDGKTIYACEYSNELDAYVTTETTKVPAGIGTACHEFGHAIGLPDLYVTRGGSTHKTLGAWDLMCYGLYNNDTHTPPSLSAYERFYMGWMTPTLIVNPDTLRLEHIATSNQAFMVVETDTHNMDGLHPDTTVFYLLENRQRTGWDIGVPGSGMLLTRINYQPSLWTGNAVNNTDGNQGVDIIEADGKTPTTNTSAGFYGKPGDAFPCDTITEYLGIPDHAITGITMNDGVITFTYRGGKIPTDPTTAFIMPADNRRTFKTMENGQLLIHSNGRTYSVYGLEIKTY